MLTFAFRIAACVNAVVAWWMGVRRRPRRKTVRPTDSVECRVAVHEAGHTLVAWACSVVRDITYVTIESKTGGHVHYRRFALEDPDHHWCEAVISLSGLAAELLVYSKTRSKPAEEDLLAALVAVCQVGSSRPSWGRLTNSTRFATLSYHFHSMLPSDLPVIAVKFELDLNNKQITKCRQGAGIARFTSNWSLAHRISLIEQKRSDPSIKVPTSLAEHRRLIALKPTDFPWMYEVSKSIPQEALRDLDKAFANFYEGRTKFPKFKKKHRCKASFRLHGNSPSCPTKIEVQSRYVKLPTFGWLRSKEKYLDRRLEKLGVEQILSATVSEEANRWYCSLSVRIRPSVPIDHSAHPSAGVDLGITTFATISSNHEITKVQSLKPLAKSLKRLRRAQRTHCKKQKGSSNRRRSAKYLARLHARVRHQRQDFLHKQTTILAKTKSVIGIEDLNVQGMSKNPHLARSILDQGFGEYRRQLTYKCPKFGSFLFVANRFEPSSKKCHVCKYKLKKLGLSARTWTCPSCNTVHDRDGTAAINLEDISNIAYREFLGNGARKSPTPVEIPMAAERSKERSTSYESLKQEVSTEVT